MAIPPAPSNPPTSVSASSSSTSITVQWGPVDCADRNGDITGYSVRYGEVGSGRTQTVNVTGETSKTISGLSTSTNYTYQVAARNSAGLGPYSDLQNIPTDSKLQFFKLQLVRISVLQVLCLCLSLVFLLHQYCYNSV